MRRNRTSLIAAAVAALCVACAADCALAGFVRVGDLLCAARADGNLLGLAALCEDAESAAFSCAAAPGEPSPSRGPAEDEDSPPAWRAPGEPLPVNTGACGTQASSGSGGHGPASALPTSLAQAPQPALSGRLPTEMGPHFSNPPPWTPLKPPRG